MIEFDHEAEDTASSRSARMKRRHREVLAIACTVWLLAFLLREGPNGRVAVRGLAQFPLPQTCASRVIFGMRCPGCGLTRSIIHVAEGDWRASWHDHRVGGLLAVVIALQIPYRLYALRRPGRRLLSTFWLSVIGYGLIAMLVINWLFDVAAGRLTSP